MQLRKPNGCLQKMNEKYPLYITFLIEEIPWIFSREGNVPRNFPQQFNDMC